MGETFSGIRVVRAFGRETRELLDYLLGRHTVLRKGDVAHCREMILWTSWGLLLGAVNASSSAWRPLKRLRPRLNWRHHGVSVA
ncbi:MAG: hypothetical protein U1F83_13190 [Verrucomicrobiota bacterium]